MPAEVPFPGRQGQWGRRPEARASAALPGGRRGWDSCPWSSHPQCSSLEPSPGALPTTNFPGTISPPPHFPSQQIVSFPSWTEMYWFLAKFNHWHVASVTGELRPSVPPLYSVPRIPVPSSVCMGHRAGVRECLSDERTHAFSKASGPAGDAHS